MMTNGEEKNRGYNFEGVANYPPQPYPQPQAVQLAPPRGNYHPSVPLQGFQPHQPARGVANYPQPYPSAPIVGFTQTAQPLGPYHPSALPQGSQSYQPTRGVANYPQPYPPPPPIGFTQPAQPLGPYHPSALLEGSQSYQPTRGYPVTGEAPAREDPLFCFGIGIGWFLFVLGAVFGVIPWYAGAIMLLFNKDPREKSGLVACTIVAILGTIMIVLFLTIL